MDPDLKKLIAQLRESMAYQVQDLGQQDEDNHRRRIVQEAYRAATEEVRGATGKKKRPPISRDAVAIIVVKDGDNWLAQVDQEDPRVDKIFAQDRGAVRSGSADSAFNYLRNIYARSCLKDPSVPTGFYPVYVHPTNTGK